MSKKGTAVNQIKEMAADWKSGVQVMVHGAKEITDSLHTIKSSVSELSSAYADLRKKEEDAARSSKADEDRTKGIDAVTNAYTALYGALDKVVKKGIEFEDQMVNLKAGSDASPALLDASAAAAQQYGPMYGVSDTKAAEALNAFQGAGYNLAKLANGDLKSALALISAGELTSAEAANHATDAMKTYSKEQLSLSSMANVTVGAANAATTSVKDIAAANQALGSSAASVGAKFQDVNAVFALLGQHSLRGAAAGKSLDASMQALIRPSEEAKKVMKDLGLEFFTSEGKMKSFGQIAEMMNTKLARFNDKSKDGILTSIFGKDGAPAMRVLTDEGASGMKQASSAVQDSSADDVAKAKLNSLSGQLRQFSATVGVAASQLMQQLKPALTPIIDLVTRLVKGFSDASQGTKNATAVLLVSGTAALGSVAAFTKLEAAVKAVKLAFDLLAKSPLLLAVSAVVAIVSAGYTVWAQYNEQQKKVKASQDALNASIAKAKTTNDPQEMADLREKAKQVKEVGDKYQEVSKTYKEYTDQLGKLSERHKETSKTAHDLRDKAAELKAQMDPLNKQMQDLGVTEENYKEKSKELTDAMHENVDGVLAMTSAKVEELATNQDHLNSMESLKKEYQELTSHESLNEKQKARLSDVTSQLCDLVPGLRAATDEHGRSILQNTSLIDDHEVAIRKAMQADKEWALTILEDELAAAEAEEKILEARTKNLEDFVKRQESMTGNQASSGDNQIGDNQRLRNMESADNIKAGNEVVSADQRDGIAALKNQLDMVKSGHYQVKKEGTDNYPTGDDGTDTGGTGNTTVSKPQEPQKSQDQILQEAYQKELTDSQHAFERGTINREQYIQRLQAMDSKYSAWLAQHENERYSLENEIAKQSFQASSDWIEKKKQEMQDAGKSDKEIAQMEIDAWQRVASRDIYLTEDRKRAEEQLRQAKHDLATASFKESEDWISKTEQKMKDQGASEAEINKMRYDAWTRINDRIKDHVYNLEDAQRATEELANVQRDMQQTMADDLRKAREIERDKAMKQAEEDAHNAEQSIQDQIDGLDKQAQEEKYLLDLKKEQQALDDLMAERSKVAADKHILRMTTDKDGHVVKEWVADQTKLKDLDKQIDDQKSKIGEMQKDHETQIKREDLEKQLKKVQDENKQKLDAEQAYWDAMLSDEQINQEVRNQIQAKGYEEAMAYFEDYKNNIVQGYQDMQADIMAAGGLKPPEGYASADWTSPTSNNDDAVATEQTTAASDTQHLAVSSSKSDPKNQTNSAKANADQTNAGKTATSKTNTPTPLDARSRLKLMLEGELHDLEDNDRRKLQELAKYWKAQVNGENDAENQINTVAETGLNNLLTLVGTYLGKVVTSYKEAYQEIQQIVASISSMSNRLADGTAVDSLQTSVAASAGAVVAAAQSFVPSHQAALALSQAKGVAADSRLSGLVNQHRITSNNTDARQVVVNGPLIDKVVSNATDAKLVAGQVMSELQHQFFRMGSGK